MTVSFSQAWGDSLQALLSRGSAAGADLVEVFLEHTDHLGLLAEQDRITSVNPTFARGAGLRVFLNGRDGFVSTNDLTPDGLTRALDQALAMLGLQHSSLAPSSSFEGLSPLKDYGINKLNWLEQCPSMADASARLLEGTAQLEQLGQHLQVRRGSYARDWQEVLVAASDGTFARDIRLHQSTGLSVLAADGDHRSSIGRLLKLLARFVFF